MRKILKALLVLTILMFNFHSINLVADAASVSGNYEYELINDNREVRIIKYLGNEEYVYLPNTIKNKPVTELGGESFADNDVVKDVKFNSKLQTIHSGAFYDCDNLRKVVIPNNVKNIYSERISWANRETFGHCDNLKTVVIGSGVKSIYEYTFTDCPSLQSVTIGNNVKEINDSAFAQCNKLSTIKFGTNLKDINNRAFYNCDSLTSITLPSNTRYIGYQAFYDCDNLISITFNNKLQTIDKGAFYSCDSLEKVAIPNSVKNIYSESVSWDDRETFGYCENLKSVTIGYGLKSIEESTFEGNKSLKSVTIGNGVESIKDKAFYQCTNLSSVKFGTGLLYIYSYAFYNCDSLINITLPSNTDFIGYQAFYDCDKLKNITFNSKLETIDKGAFYSCDSLEKISIPNSVKNIYSGSVSWDDRETFGYCENLKSVTIGSGLKTIEESTFEGNKSLESVTIGSGVENINDSAFSECTNLSSVKFGTGLKNINSYAFYNCDSLKTITLPYNTRYIGFKSFFDCDNLKKIGFNGRLETIDEGAFYSCDALEKVVIPDSVTNIYSEYVSWDDRETFGYCENLKSVVIGSGLEYIGDSLFSGCEALESVTIGKNVENIYRYAFYGTADLEKVYFLGNAPAISDSAFQNSNSDLTLYHKSGATGFNNIGYNTGIFNSNDTHRTVTFKSNGTSAKDVKISTIKGSTVPQPSIPTRTGYSFVGWYRNPEGTGTKWNFNEDTVNSNTTLYAKWSIKKYTLKFDARGGKTPSSSKTVSYNSKMGTLPVPTRENYIFLGWYPAQDGSGTRYTESTKMPARNMTLYAKWKKLSTPSITLTSGSKKATIKWNKIDGASGYEIARSTSKSGTYKIVKSSSTTSYTNTGLTTGKTYYYKVRAYKTVNGEKVYSSYSSVKYIKIK